MSESNTETVKVATNTVKAIMVVGGLLVSVGIAWGTSTYRSNAVEKEMYMIRDQMSELDSRQRDSEIRIGAHAQQLDSMQGTLRDIRSDTRKLIDLFLRQMDG